MSSQERRLAPRKNVSVPLRYRLTTTNNAELFTGETVNLSERGVYFTVDKTLTVGTPLEMYFTVPRELTGRSAEEVRCSGRVVHVLNEAGPNRKVGIGAQIDRYEPITAASKWGN